MRDIRLTFTDAEFAKLKKAKMLSKGNLSWHDFIMKSAVGISVKKRVSSGSHSNNKQKPQTFLGGAHSNDRT